MLERLKKLKRVISGKDFFYKPTIDIKCQKYGSEYGGWWIYTDGLVDTDQELIVFSFGLGEDISFDLEMIKNFNCKVYGFDPTPKSIEYVEAMNLGNNFELFQYALSDSCEKTQFSLPENENHISGSLENINSSNVIDVECKDLKTICDDLNISNIDILKMDIEGSEYKVVENMIANKIFPNQVLIEYHHFFNNIKNDDTRDSIDLLLTNGYELFHIDAYNYSFIKVNEK